VLCLEKFIDPASGALREFFAADWSPAPGVEGRICEPGHHYEWAFLLDYWARLTSRNRPEVAERLIAFADSRGLDACRGVAVNAVLADGSIHDPVARLWAQAERMLMPALQPLSQVACRKRMERVSCCSKAAISRTPTSNR
jgi:mannose/cellobiose epimerase-like protein (N-acyl-D-glucosamine 2-epimerase family)